MFFINFLLNIITYVALIIMTLCSIPLFFWLLFIKKKSRFAIASKLIFRPWSFIINNLLCHINLKIKGKEYIDKKRKTIYICNHQSWLDITTFINTTSAVPISKEEVKFIPFLGIMIVYNGPIYLQRNNKKDRLG
ncbi:MAG: 1-acyl-sn-glycerol-3-phosphate acyltransferase, partial [Spirochaetota bacterium]|nr:1-acyl-sn-glycerol-3-phosphate acyltransferase [Spirochaetota bacterium]